MTTAPPVGPGYRGIIDVGGLDVAIAVLTGDGYRVVGPTVREGAVVYDEISSVAEMPAGWTDEQDGGTYRLHRREDGALFGYAVGPHSWKRYLFPPRTLLWRAQRTEDGFAVESEEEDPPKYAFLGVRGCELAAIHIQDRVFLDSGAVDPVYAARRSEAFVIAVNCSTAASTCFCVSMGTGPAVGAGFDLALTEILEEGVPHFVVDVGSNRGAGVLERVPHRAAAGPDEAQAASVVEATARSMGRSLDTGGIQELLAASREHPRWDDVAERCLACGNCTMVCPTCFCSTVEDTSDLAGTTAERWRRWDSCYTLDFTHLADGSVRSSTRSRYRQWLTHKLGTWFDQFGTSGCVGCGRCITWCPVGIDLTEEILALRTPPAGRKEG